VSAEGVAQAADTFAADVRRRTTAICEIDAALLGKNESCGTLKGAPSKLSASTVSCPSG